MGKYFLGLDQGTTGSTAILFDEEWRLAARGYREIRQIYPQTGWVEHDAMNIWEATCEAVQAAMDKIGADPSDILGIGIDHEGESIMLWDKETGLPIYNTIVWQDRRTAREADALAEKYGPMVREHTGLMLDSYFSALKLRWLLQNVPEAKELLAQGRLLAGTMDVWLVWKMTRGQLHVTDVGTASRTMLMNLQSEDWDQDILDLLEIDRSILPKICDSAGFFGYTVPEDFCGIKAPIGGIVVDQHAALFGQACFEPGTVKTTYGTGCFMLMNTGDKPVFSPNGLLTAVGWRLNGKTTYVLDGGIYISGAATQWLRDGLKIIKSAPETEPIVQAMDSNNGLYFVPAFTGLAAPYWDSYARGMIIGITGGTTREDLIRATLESSCYQVCDLVDVMEKDSGVPIKIMRCDGGASVSNFMMQFQSDLLNIPLNVPEIIDTTALGAAYMAAIGIGAVSSTDELVNNWRLKRSFSPNMTEEKRTHLLGEWRRAVERCRNWVQD